MTKEKFFEEIVNIFSVPKYCKQFNIKQPYLKGSRKSEGIPYVSKLYAETVKNLQVIPENYEEQLNIIKAFTQNGRVFDCFIPNPKEFLTFIFRGKINFFRSAYKGVPVIL